MQHRVLSITLLKANQPDEFLKVALPPEEGSSVNFGSQCVKVHRLLFQSFAQRVLCAEQRF